MYFGGEEPYDEDQGQEISKAVIELGCEPFDNHETTLMRRHLDNTKALERIKKARAQYR